MHHRRPCEERKRWTRAACIWRRGLVSIWRGGVSPSLPPPRLSVPSSLCPYFLLKPATCIMTKISIPVQRAGGRALVTAEVDYQLVKKKKKHQKQVSCVGTAWETCFAKPTLSSESHQTHFPTFLQPLGLVPVAIRDRMLNHCV